MARTCWRASCCASVEGALYVFGGEWFDNSGGGVYAQVWRYDPQSDSWTGMGRMPTPRHGLGAVAVRNAIATIAGAAQPSGVETTAKLDWFTPWLNTVTVFSVAQKSRKKALSSVRFRSISARSSLDAESINETASEAPSTAC